MTDTENQKLGVASRLYVRLRHNAGRVIDVVWLVQNDVYAKEVLRIARASPDPEVQRLADRFESLLEGAAETAEGAAVESPTSDNTEVASHYIGALR